MHGQHPLPPRVTLNSGKLITIDWGCWQLQEDDVYLHVCFPSLKSHPNSLPRHFLGIHFARVIESFSFCSHISSLFIHHCLYVSPLVPVSLSHSVSAYQWEEVMWDVERRTLRSFPRRLPSTRAPIGLNWNGIKFGIWVCRLICTEWVECVLVCVPSSAFVKTYKR